MDPSWEFQAPQFVDFNNIGSSGGGVDDNADEFFNVDMESGESWTETRTRSAGSTPQRRSESVSEEGKAKKPSNLVTSWGSKKATAPKAETPKRKALRAAVNATIQSIRNSPKMNFKRTPAKRLGTNQPSPRLAQARSRTSTAGSEISKNLSKSSAALPRTPDVMKRYRNKIQQSTSKHIVVNSTLTKPTSSSLLKVQPAIKSGLSVKPLMKPTLTVPKEFHFATSKPAIRPGTGDDAPDFSRMLRSYNRPPASMCTNPTQPQPFPRQERLRSRSADAHNKKFESQAELVKKFHGQTPDRFKSRPEKPRTRNRSASPVPRLTVPVTPQLNTRGRSRPANVLSQADREDLEIEENCKKQFKAHGIGETLPKFKYAEVEKKSCTIPTPFSLSGQGTLPKPTVEEYTFPAFTAKPVSKKILSGALGVPDKKVHHLIEPQSPAFALKSRMVERNEKKAAEAAVQVHQEPVIKAKPAPHRGVPAAVAVAKRNTQPAPFSFEERDHQTQQRKEEKIKKIYEEEKAQREFHANPISKAVEVGGKLPEKLPVHITKPEPFRMLIEDRVESRVAKWQDNLAKELEEQRKATQFKATEAKVLTSAPFTAKPSDKPLCEIANVVLHSDRRAEERAAYELERSAKEAQLQGAKLQQEERKKREEEEQVVKLRKAIVHKAQPVKHYRPVEVRPSNKPLTLPASPNLQAGKSGKMKAGNSTFSQ